MTHTISFLVSPDDEGRRLDALVAAYVPDVSRSLAQKLVVAGRVRINNLPVKASRRATKGDRVEVEVLYPPSLQAEPEDIPLTIVYRDDEVAVVDKPAGLVVHPAAGHAGGTLANALVAMFPSAGAVGAKERPGIVHRLDKDTSGLLVVALTPHAQHALQGQIALRTAQRRYLALATGHPVPAEARISAPVGRHPTNRKRMAVHVPGARPALTSYRVLEYFPGFAFLEAILHTGRTHQIRVHLAAAGHPLAGDTVYGGRPVDNLRRQFLHAYRLGFHSPSSGEWLEFESALPSDLQVVLQRLRGAS